jgi:CHAT domain-containing protein
MRHHSRHAVPLTCAAVLTLLAGVSALAQEPAPTTARDQWYGGISSLFDSGAYDEAAAVTGLLKSYRMKAFLDSQGFDSLAGLPDGLAAQQRDLDARRADLTAHVLLSGDLGEIRGGLARLEALMAEQAALARGFPEGCRLADIPGRESSFPPPNVGPANAVVLTMVDAGPRLLFALSEPAQPTEGYAAAATPELMARLTAWRSSLTACEEDATESSALLGELLGPLAERATRAQRLLLVPDGRLFYVPFAALRTDDGQPLGARVECLHAVSLSQFALAQRRASALAPATSPALAFCDPFVEASDQLAPGQRGYVYVPPSRGAGPGGGTRGYAYVPAGGERGGEQQDAGQPAPDGGGQPGETLASYYRSKGLTIERLPLTLREAETVRAAGMEGSRYLQGLRASETSARKALAGDDVVHLAAATVWDDENPLLSSIVLSPDRDNDGYLTALELLDLTAGAPLVALPLTRRCPDDPAEGDGLMALVWALTYAGVPRVLTTVTRTGDGDGGAFTRSVYAGLARGVSPGEALRAAVATTGAEGPPSETVYRGGAEIYGVP